MSLKPPISFLLAVMFASKKVQSSQTVPIAVGWMNKAVCILGIVVMVAKGTLTPSVSVRCRNPQPDFKETVSVNGTNYMGVCRN